MRILIVEDDLDMQSILKQVLEAEKFTVDSCSSGEESFLYLDVVHYDLCLIDLELPGMDGKELIKSIREKKIDSPIIIISARQQLEERISGLDIGADDYLVKPFELEELLARIRVCLKFRSTNAASSENPQKEGTLTWGALILDSSRRTVCYDGHDIPLTNREFLMLKTLLENRDIVLSRDTLLEKVCGYDYMGETNIVDVYVRHLRAKIDETFGIHMLQTVRGVGYVIRSE